MELIFNNKDYEKVFDLFYFDWDTINYFPQINYATITASEKYSNSKTNTKMYDFIKRNFYCVAFKRYKTHFDLKFTNIRGYSSGINLKMDETLFLTSSFIKF